jgi:benzoylformate decarboxylase
MTGAEVVAGILKNEGVKYVFGVPGNSEVPLLDALAQTPGIRYISAIHESVSIGMADGYARASGKVGVVLVHTTPGTANIMGNLSNAYDAGTPLVVIAGQQDSRLRWCDSLLDSDLLPMVSQHTKDRWWLGRAEDIATGLNRAFKEATTPPTGPVFLVIPRDLQSQTLAIEHLPGPRRPVPTATRPDREYLEKAAQLLVRAERPAIMAGCQVASANAIPELINLAETLGAPVFTTGLVPSFIFPTNHPLYYGRVPPIGFGLPGLDSPADVLVAVGSKLFKQLFHIEGPIIPPVTKLIHIDHDPKALAKECPAEVALVGSPRTALAELAAEVNRLMSAAQRQKTQRRFRKLKTARERARAACEADFKKEWNDEPMRPSRAVREIANALPEDSVVVDEAVMLTSYVASIMDFNRPGSYFCSITCLGWGLPASLGVALGGSRRPVVALVGDGSALFGIQALWSAAKYEIPVIMVVLNNRGYAAVKWGLSSYPDRKSPEGVDLGCDLSNVDFPKLAEAFGVSAQQIEVPDKIGPAIRRAIRSRKPALLDLMVDPADVGYGMPRLS